MVAKLNEIPEGMASRANNVRDLVIGARTMPLYVLNSSDVIRLCREARV
jgi:hypothetical protein